MSDDILGDMLARTSGEGSRKPKGGIGDVLGRAVSSARTPPAEAKRADGARLVGLGVDSWRAVLRYLGADHVPPLLSALPVAAAERLVMAHDAEGQAWIASQTSLIEGATAAQQATAVEKAEAVVTRLLEEDRLSAPAAPARPTVPADRVAPVSGGLGFEAMVPREAAPKPALSAVEPAARPTAETAGDTLIATLAQLVDGARGCAPAELRALASQLEHPVLAQGLALIADGADPHALAEQVQHLAADWLTEQERQLAAMQQALLAIRFGDDAAGFRARVR